MIRGVGRFAGDRGIRAAALCCLIGVRLAPVPAWGDESNGARKADAPVEATRGGAIDRPVAVLDGRVGVLGGTDRLRYWVETRISLELSIAPSWFAVYEHTERAIFLDLDRAPPSGTIQLDRASSSDLLQVGRDLAPGIDVGLALGYARADRADRPGAVRTAILGPAMRWHLPALRTDLAAVAGAALAVEGLEDDTWTRLSLRTGMPSPWDALGLEAEYEALGDPWPTGGYLEVGPFAEFPAGRVHLGLAVHYVRVDNQPLLTLDDSGWGFWLRMRADGSESCEASTDPVQAGGGYRFGVGDEGETSRFLAEARYHQPEARWAGFLEYAARRDFGRDPTGTYRVALGPGARLGLPALLGCDPRDGWVALEFLHRSDHALDPDPERVARSADPSDLGPMIEHTNVNIFPRLTFATDGWSALGRRTPAPAPWELFATVGRRLAGHETDAEFAGQLGLRVNVVRARSWTAYLEGVVATGGEAPEQAIELGWEAGPWSLFALWNDYGIEERSGATSDVVVGVGIRL